jgi:hypothetical protein
MITVMGEFFSAFRESHSNGLLFVDPLQTKKQIIFQIKVGKVGFCWVRSTHSEISV